MPPASARFSISASSARCRAMSPHLTHVGVHDHGFNNVSTYGNAVAARARAEASRRRSGAQHFCELALKVSGAVQARRWTPRRRAAAIIYSFNGAHSLFVDTIRSLRALALSHRLGHRLSEEQDVEIDLLERLLQHARRDRAVQRLLRQRSRYLRSSAAAWRTSRSSMPRTGPIAAPTASKATRPSARGRAASRGRCSGSPSSSSFLTRSRIRAFTGEPRAAVDAWMLEAARATCDFYIDHAACADGIPYWDTGAPGLATLEGWAERDADPFNDVEPVDSSAAAIAAQGLLRLGHVLERRRSKAIATRRPDCECSRRCFDPREAVSQPVRRSPGIDPACDLSPAQWLGSRAEGREDPARRVVPVGRLSCARSGAVREATGRPARRI